MVSLERILCPVDLSDSSRHAVRYAAAVASWYDARLTVLHVFSNVPVFNVAPALGASTMPPIAVEEIDRDTQRQVVREFMGPIADRTNVEVSVVDAADPRREILQQARSLEASLLVMGTHGRSGFDHLLLGSVTEKVLRKSSCPVMVVPPHAGEAPMPPAAPFTRILCAIDFSPSSLHALTYALDLAQEADARLSLLYVIELPPELAEFPFASDLNINALRPAAEAEYLRRLRALVPAEAREYCSVATQLAEGRAHGEILRVASEERSDLIVMGVQGRGALDLALFGSNAHTVMRKAGCAVLAVPLPPA